MKHLIVTIIPLLAAMPALAVNGEDAANLCLRQPAECRVNVSADGGIALVSRGVVIWCAAPEAECAVVHRRSGTQTDARRQNAVMAAEAALSGS